jgi:hypothetical protein
LPKASSASQNTHTTKIVTLNRLLKRWILENRTTVSVIVLAVRWYASESGIVILYREINAGLIINFNIYTTSADWTILKNVSLWAKDWMKNPVWRN